MIACLFSNLFVFDLDVEVGHWADYGARMEPDDLRPDTEAGGDFGGIAQGF